ncbi:hypothetical protein V8G54_019258 [Vigna mungo]|uniref:Reverse transcriptase domain-containing protein n=1 Tax=Vigna mungo TaxID=3915 RepID=A0AAQ3RTK1_VIGMU
MAENTRLKDLQNEVKNNVEDLRRLSQTVEKLEAALAIQSKLQDKKMDQIQIALQQLLENASHSIGNSSNSGSAARVNPLSMTTMTRNISLGFPHFDGSTPVLEWIYKADKFFNYHNTSDIDRVEIASMHFEKEVIPWFQMLQKMEAVTTWTALSRALESQFGPSPFDCPMADLFKLQQLGSVSDYYLKFMALANRSNGLTEEVVLNCFINGLKVDIKRDVVAMTPATLLRAVALAKLYEEKYSTITKSSPSYSPRFPTSLVSSIPSNSSPRNTLKQPFSEAKPLTPPLLPTPPGPQLKNPQYDIAVQDILSLDAHHLSLNALKGGLGVGTIKFKASIGTLPVTVLIDGGSSDTFLQPRVAKFLKLPIVQAPTFRVMVGNGNYMEFEGLIQDLKLHAQGNVFQLSAFLLPISGADLILGASWLKTIGPHLADYETLQIRFLYGGKFNTLQGDNDHLLHTAQLHHIRRLVHTNAIAEVYNMQLIHEDVIPSSLLELQLPVEMTPDLALLLQTYSFVFSIPSGLPPPRSHVHQIPLLEGSNPVKVRPYRYPHSQKEEIERLVAQMLQEGIIQPSSSPFSSPIILVKKKDGSWRVCTDYRALNAITIKDSFPIPTVDELIDELYGASYFSKLDLRSGYHQILLKLEDRYKTAFRTHQGLYEWLVMPFGLSNAPATFQSLMNKIFKGLLRRFVLVFFDDILVYSVSWKDHLQHLERVLSILKDNHLFAKFSKCTFGVQQINYLGDTLSGDGVVMDVEKLEAVRNWIRPSNQKQLRGFLGLTGYYRCFVKGYANIAAPLTDLLKKEAFKWTDTTEQAFTALKTALTTTPVLAIPNFLEPFVLETDASGSGIGAVLSQHKHPITYFSKKLSPRMQTQSAYIREFYAITEALAKFRHYLLGHKFILKTDQKSLKDLLDQTLQTPAQQQWLPKFLGYDFTIQYTPGKDNIPADALSRSLAMAWSEPVNSWLKLVADATQKDAALLQIYQQCIQHAGRFEDYTLHKDTLINMILAQFHTFKVGGHAGTTRTTARIGAQFYWPRMREDIRKYIKECVICQQAKVSQSLPTSLLQPLPIPNIIWEDIAMDFITNLPLSHGHSNIMVMIDRLSKFAHFIPLKPGFNSKVAVYGKPPPSLIRYEYNEEDTSALQDTQNYMKNQADKKRRDVTLEVGDLALVKLQPYRQHSVVLRKHQKLSLRYFGPFEVIAKIEQVAYKLLLPESAKIHPVFHISLLKKFHGNQKQQYLPLPLTTSEFGPLIQPIRILDSRTIVRNGKQVEQRLVQWDSLSEAENSWEDLVELQQSYPNFNFVDKVAVKEGSTVTRVGEKGNGGRHVASKAQNDDIRKRTRMKRESIKLKEFVR